MKPFRFSGILFLCFLWLATSTQLHAKEYTIPELRIEVSIQPDGSVHIIEHRTYVFDGSYTWANYKLPKAGFSAIRDIQVSEQQQSYLHKNTEGPGTFLVEVSDNAYNIKWYYDASDEQRVFTISYTLDNTIITGPQWSEFFWNYAASGREKATDTLSISIQLPEDITAADLHSWIREPDWKIERSLTQRGFLFTGSDISKHENVKIRTVFPTAVFNENIAITKPDFSLEWAQQDEAAFQENQRRKAIEQQKSFELGIQLMVAIIGLALLCFVFFYRKYGTRHKVHLSKNESLMIPGNQRPAVIGWLLAGRNFTGGHVMATLLDLARRGFFNIKEEEPEETKWYNAKKSGFNIISTDQKPGSDLTDWEQNLHSFVQQRIQEEGTKLEDVFKFSDKEVYTWFKGWKEMLKGFTKQQGWIDAESYKGVYWNLGVQLTLLLLGVIGMIMVHPIMGVGLFMAFICSILSVAIIRRTPKGEEQYHVWKNYYNGLKNAKEYSIPANHLGRHFIYSVAFGLNKQYIEQLFEQNMESITAIYWIVLLPGSTRTPSDIAASFSTLASSGTAVAGGGAGATAGVAGGGASGGAG